MPSTERNITRPVDERFNENGENYAFRLTTRNDENRCENRNERFYHSDTMNPMGLIHRFQHSSMIAGIMLSITLVYLRRNECFCCNHNVDMSA